MRQACFGEDGGVVGGHLILVRHDHGRGRVARVVELEPGVHIAAAAEPVAQAIGPGGQPVEKVKKAFAAKRCW